MEARGPERQPPRRTPARAIPSPNAPRAPQVHGNPPASLLWEPGAISKTSMLLDWNPPGRSPHSAQGKPTRNPAQEKPDAGHQLSR